MAAVPVLANRHLTRPIADRALVGLLAACCVVLPLLFSIALQDTFALPKVTALQAFFVAGMVLAAVAFIRERQVLRHFRPASIDVAVLAFVILNLLAFAFSINPRHSLNGERLQYQGLFTTLSYVGLFYLARIALRNEERVALLFAAIAASGSLVAAYALLQKATLDPIWGYVPNGRVFSSIGQPNALAAYLVLAVPVSAALLPRANRWQRVLLFAAITAMIVSLLFTFSRAGYIASAIALPIVAFPLLKSISFRPSALLLHIALLLVITSTAGIAVEPARAAAARFWDRALSAGSFSETSTRMHLDLWRVGVQIAAEHPLLGTGQETYPEVFPGYRDRVLPPSHTAELAKYRPESPHNVYLAIADGAGIPTLVAYLAALAAFLWSVVRRIRLASRAPSLRFVGFSLLAVAVGHLVTDAFMTAEVTSSALFWILMGTGFGLYRSGEPTKTRPLQANRSSLDLLCSSTPRRRSGSRSPRG